MIEVKNGKTQFAFAVEDDEIYIGRQFYSDQKTYCLSNPFSVKKYGRDKAIELYKEWIFTRVKLAKGPAYRELIRLKELYKKTGSLKLVCWCKPKACHGDVIATVIEYLIEEEKNTSKNTD